MATKETQPANIDEGETEENDVEADAKGKKAARHDAGAADLEKVTDYEEEKEIAAKDIQDVRNKSLNGFFFHNLEFGIQAVVLQSRLDANKFRHKWPDSYCLLKIARTS